MNISVDKRREIAYSNPMTTTYLTRNEIPAVIRGAFPGYTGPKWKVNVCTQVHLTGMEWGGGSRSQYHAVDLATGAVALPIAAATVDLPAGVAIVEHVMFCGKDMGCTIYLRPENAAPLLPAPPTVTEHQRKVIEATCAYKSSYGGDSEYRRHASGLDRVAWDAAKAECIAKGWLNRAGAVTPAGRNVRGK